MKRDMELIRRMLLTMEESEETLVRSIAFEGVKRATVQYHFQLLADAGFLEAQEMYLKDRSLHMGYRLTWAGHEFLGSVRDPEIWAKTKQGAEKVGSWSVKLLADLASGFVRVKAAELGLPLA